MRIANYHTNIVLVEKDGEKLLDLPVEGEKEEGLTDRSLLDVEDISDMVYWLGTSREAGKFNGQGVPLDLGTLQ